MKKDYKILDSIISMFNNDCLYMNIYLVNKLVAFCLAIVIMGGKEQEKRSDTCR